MRTRTLKWQGTKEEEEGEAEDASNEALHFQVRDVVAGGCHSGEG
jgi:hypothetical protein